MSVLRKIIEIDATRCHILRLKCTKFDFYWGSPPDPAGRRETRKGEKGEEKGGKERERKKRQGKGKKEGKGRGRKGKAPTKFSHPPVGEGGSRNMPADVVCWRGQMNG